MSYVIIAIVNEIKSCTGLSISLIDNDGEVAGLGYLVRPAA